MSAKQEHAKLKSEPYLQGLAMAVEKTSTPTLATDMVAQCNVEEACAVIDCMSPLGAAFIFLMFRLRAKEQNNRYAKRLLKRAQALRMKSLKGLTHARDEMFKTTGIFVP